jgi:type IV fimbrial biogenesis protein FimT
VIQGHIRLPVRTARPPGACRGLSLVELVVVVTIVAILSSVAVPRVGNMLRRSRLDLASRRLMADLQLVRSQAIRDSAERKLALDLSRQRYAMPLYGGTTRTHTVELDASPYEGVRLAATSYQPAEIRFNRLGLPQGGGTITLRAGSETITIQVSSTTGRATRAWGP